jgi:hypothetical protein
VADRRERPVWRRHGARRLARAPRLTTRLDLDPKSTSRIAPLSPERRLCLLPPRLAARLRRQSTASPLLPRWQYSPLQCWSRGSRRGSSQRQSSPRRRQPCRTLPNRYMSGRDGQKSRWSTCGARLAPTKGASRAMASTNAAHIKLVASSGCEMIVAALRYPHDPTLDVGHLSIASSRGPNLGAGVLDSLPKPMVERERARSPA